MLDADTKDIMMLILRAEEYAQHGLFQYFPRTNGLYNFNDYYVGRAPANPEDICFRLENAYYEIEDETTLYDENGEPLEWSFTYLGSVL